MEISPEEQAPLSTNAIHVECVAAGEESGSAAPLSKNAQKKLLKGTKEKKEKPAPAPKADTDKKEKKKKEKAPEEVFIDNTPKGQKKDISGVFPTAYQPKYVEAAWQDWWESSGFYAPDITAARTATDDEKFVIVIPPPNVTGTLHLGHAMTVGIEDTLTRWHRMKGKVTLWVPGTDHAGIATQSVVERRLMKDEGLTRHDLGREKFVERVWDWKNTYGNRITEQIRFMGSSVDWSREAFTLDNNGVRAVTEAFVRFYEDGLIYRDSRLINWSCALQSAISDIEVEYIDLEGRTFLSVPNHTRDKYEFGTLTSFAYRVYDEALGGPGAEELVVATTRLETMLGDTAVAVHPNDLRYKHLHGKYLVHPFVDRKIPIITDGELVDMEFGTGAVKVTPSHDPNDYSCGKRNGLEFIVMLSGNGQINENGGKFKGMMRYDARVAVEKELQELGLLRGKVPNKMRLGLCSRSGDIIEPMTTPQWFVNCDSMAASALAAVENGELTILPSMHESTWRHWLGNIRDWCISRQLWWGHRIPAYFARSNASGEAELEKNDPANASRWVVARTEGEARTMAASKLSVPEDQIILEQDEDVLDTWFSSGLFPFSVFGWPEKTADFESFFPTTLLETGMDILFFWVARMVMMSLHLTKKLPFKTVYLHAMVRDKYGRKMSKSLGNVIDPLEVINGCSLQSLLDKIGAGNVGEKEMSSAMKAQQDDFPNGIPECGADALRFGLLAYTVQGRDVNLDISRVVGYRQFCNKLWNAVKFALTYLSDFVPSTTMQEAILECGSKRDLFILSKLNGTIRDANLHMGNYGFAAVASALHSFFLYDLCDVYLELIKPIVNPSMGSADDRTKYAAQSTLYTCLEQYLRLAHPLMPFVTEELWQRLPNLSALTTVPSIMISRYPEAVEAWFNPQAEEDMKVVLEAIHAARSIRADYRIANNVKVNFSFSTDSADMRRIMEAQAADFCTLSKSESIVYFEGELPTGWSVKVVSDKLTLLVNLAGLVDVDAELERLQKDVTRISESLEQYRRKATATGYETKVPEAVRIANTEKMAMLETELQNTENAMASFASMKL